MSAQSQPNDQDPSAQIVELFKAMDQRDGEAASKAMLELRGVLQSVGLDFRLLTNQFEANDILAPSRVVTMMAMMDSEHEGEALRSFAELRKILKQSGLTFEEIITVLDRKGNERQAADETVQMLETYRLANQELTDVCGRLLKENADLRNMAAQAQAARVAPQSTASAGHRPSSGTAQPSHASSGAGSAWRRGGLLNLDDDDVRAIHRFSVHRDTGPDIADRGRRYVAKRFRISIHSPYSDVVDVANGTDSFSIEAPKRLRREDSFLVPVSIYGALKYRRFIHMSRTLGLIVDGNECHVEGPVLAAQDNRYYYIKVPSPLRPRYFYMEPKIFNRLYEPE